MATEVLIAEELAINIFRRLERSRPVGDLRLLKCRCQSFAEAIDQMLRGIRSVAGRELRPKFDQLERLKNEILQNGRDAEGPFRLYVVGPGKSGKSSTINALVSANVAEVQVIPCTWRVDVYMPKSDTCSLHDYHGNVRNGSAIELAAIIAEDERKRRESEQRVREEFKRLRDNLDLPAREELKMKLQRDNLYHSPYIEARWGVVDHLAFDGIWLVDTPGLNQEDPMGGEGSQRRDQVDQRARDYYSRADGVLWIIDAQVIAAAGTMKALEDIETSFKKLGGTSENVVGVLNRIDLVRKDKGEDAVQRVIADASNRFDGLFSTIIAFSAYDARPDANGHERERSGLIQLREAIDRVFRRTAGELRMRSRCEGQSCYERESIEILDKYHNQLMQDLDDYDRRKRQIISACEEASTSIIRMIDTWVSDHLPRIEQNIKVRLLGLWDIESESEQMRRLNDDILEITKVDRAYQEGISEIRRIRERLIEKSEQTACFSEYKYLDFIHTTSIMPSFSGQSLSHQTFRVPMIEPGFWRVVSGLWERISGGKRETLTKQVRQSFSANKESAKKWGKALIEDAQSSMLNHLEHTFADAHMPTDRAADIEPNLMKLRTLAKRPWVNVGAPGLLIGRLNTLTVTTQEVFG